MSAPPAIVIRLELEAPRVYLDAVTESEAARLEDWLVGHDAYLELVARARELEAEKRVT